MAGTSYTRQSTLTDGDTITAALFNDEYNKLVSAFAYTTTGTTGHQHDGGAAEGGNIHTIGDQNFLNKIVVDTTNNRWGVFVEVGGSAVEQIRIQDGAIVPVTDSDIDLGTSSLEFKDGYFDGTIHVDTLDVDANATIAGTLGVTGNTTIGGTLVVTGTTTLNGGTLTLGDAASDNVVFGADVNSNIIPNTDSAFDLGSSSQEWRDLYLDGTAHIDTLDVDVNATIAGTLGVTGVLTASSLDISGDIDVNGTTNLDVVDIDGAVQLDATLTVGANDQGYDIIIYGDTASANLTWDTSVDDLIFNGAARAVIPDGQLVLGSTAVTSTAAELNLLDNVSGLVQADLTKLAALDATAAEINLIDGGTSRGTTAVADGDGILINDGGTMRMTTVQTVSTYMSAESVGGGNIVTTGALGSGSIAAGFGAIDNGASNITNGGLLHLDVDADADDISGDSATGRLTIGAGQDLNLYHGGTNSYIVNDTGDLIIKTGASDEDFIIQGNDGGSAITPFKLDMSAGGDLFLTGGLIDLKNDGSNVSQIKFYCESSNAHAQTLIGAPHAESGSNTLTLPSSGGDSKLLSATSTATLTNKTINASQLVNASVVLAKMAANSVDSDQYVDGSIDTVHIGADQITNAKIADDQIDSEHYVDGSIDNAHIADDQINSEHYADGSIDTAHIANSQITNDKLAAGAFAKITGTGTLAGFTSTGIDDDASQSILKLLSGNQVRIVSDKSADLVFNLQNTTNSNPYGMAIDFTAAAPDNNSRYFIKGADSGADRFYIWSDGDVQNHDNSYGAISDQRIKSNIVDANSQWNDIKAVKVRNYKKNDDIEIYGNNAATELGVVAQELEASNMSGLVKDEVLYEAIDKEVIDGNKNVGDIKHYKSVKYSILYMKAIKALQEAMTKIETLETKVQALEDA